MKVAFLALPSIDNKFYLAEDCCGSRSTARMLPYLILACASEFKRLGGEASFFDLSIEDIDLSDYDVIVYAVPWLYHNEILERMRQYRNNQIIISVPPGYARQLYCKNSLATHVIIDSPEITIARLLLGSKVKAESFEKVGVDYSLIPDHYWQHYTSAVYQITRGCRYNCAFCAWGGSEVTDTRFKIRPAWLVARDIRQLRDLSNRQYPLSLLCAQLTSSLAWLRQFSRLMQDAPYPYTSNVHLAEVTKEKLELLQASGCIEVSAGIEGLDDVVLQNINKSLTMKQTLRGIRVLGRSKMPYRLHFRFGHGESQGDINRQIKNLDLLKKAVGRGQCRGMSIGPLIHYNGTVLASNSKYILHQHPDNENALIQANIPWKSWERFVKRTKELGLFRKLRFVPQEQVTIWQSRKR